MKLTSNCPICGKVLELISELEFSPTESLNSYKCGHAFVEMKAERTPDSIQDPHRILKSLDEKFTARDYQVECVDFVRNSKFNCLIADQMGLGKTIESLLALREEYETLTPVLLLVKSATVWQWIGEYKKWCDPLPLGIFLIEGSKSWIPPGFKTYICPMDTFSRIVSKDEESQKLLDFGFKLLIVDEVHSFKNASSKRTQSLIQFIKKISHREIETGIPLTCVNCGNSWVEISKQTIDTNVDIHTYQTRHNTKCPQCNTEIAQASRKKFQEGDPNVQKMGLVFLSGTPVKNRADEFFVPLNLLAPDRFPSLERFRRRYLEQGDNGKWNRVKPYMLDAFKEATAPYVIRRERKDVLKDLPKFTRTFTAVTIEDEHMKVAYNAEIEKLKLKDSLRELTAADIQDNIFTMRRIVGMAKTKFAADYIKEFIEDTEDDKIAVGIHHHAVRDALIYQLNGLKPIDISAGADIQWKVDKWKRPENRIGIISQLGGGVGLNLQFCSEVLNVERQWNAADEEQFEDRFNRFGQENPVNANYLVARGTIDAWFSQMVENKRQICGETVGINFDPFESQETMRDMVEWAIVNKL